MKLAFVGVLLALVAASAANGKGNGGNGGNGNGGDATKDEDAGNATNAGEAEAKTADVSVKFMGSSGGMQLMANGGKNYIKMRQAKLEEVDEAGKNVAGGFKMNVAGKNEWSELKKEGDDANAVYSTTFTVTEGEVNFALTAKLSVSTTTTLDTVPCGNCQKKGGKADTAEDATTAGASCEKMSKVKSTNSTNSTKSVKQCVAPQSANCPANYTLCTKEVTIKKNELKFSFVLQGLPAFKSASNQLSYGLFLQTNDNTTKEIVTDDIATEKKKATIGGIAVVETPTIATVSAPNTTDTEVHVNVTFSDGAIDFLFPSMEVGSALYYDPSADLLPEKSDPEGEGDDTKTSGASAACVSAAVALLAAVW